MSLTKRSWKMARNVVIGAAVGVVMMVGQGAAQGMCMVNPQGDCWPDADCGSAASNPWGWPFNGGEEGNGTFCKGGTWKGPTTNRPNPPPGTLGQLYGCCLWGNNPTSGYHNIYMQSEATDCNGGTNTWWKDVACGPDDLDGKGTRPSGTPTFDGGSLTVLGCCKWADENPDGNCWNVTEATEVSDCSGGDNTYWASACPTTGASGSCPTTEPTYNGGGGGGGGGAGECKNSNGQTYFCQWATGCHKIDERYQDEPGGLSCAQLVAACVAAATSGTNEGLYTGVSESALNDDNEYGKGVICANNNGQAATSVTHSPKSANRAVSHHIALRARTLTVVAGANEVSNFSVRVVNMKGKTVAKYTVRPNSNVVLGKKVPAGSYVVEVRRVSDGVKSTSRIMLQQ